MLPSLEQMIVVEGVSLRAALETLDRNAQRIVFVVDAAGKLTGTLTDGDIRTALLKRKTLETPVDEVANRKFVSRHIDTPSEQIAELLDQKYQHIPLVDAQGVLVDYACLHRLHRIPVMDPYLNGNELKYVMDCVKTKWISSQGKYVTEFERLFAERCGGGYPMAVSNGTVALHLAMVTLGIGPGDEVIVPDLTFAASINTVIQTGATPVLVDIDPKTWCMDPGALERAITPKTRAIMPVHLYGHPCDMDRIVEIAQRHKLLIVEDAAEALGSLYRGKPVGLFGEAGCFSFFGNKMVTTGEGGMVVFKDQALYERARMLRDHGMSKDKRYWHLEVGFNYRMTNLQAAVGVAQLEQYETIVQKKLDLAAAYHAALGGCEGVTLPAEEPGCRNSFWLYTILIDEKRFGSRESLMQKFLANGIETRPAFYPLHVMPPYQQYVRAGDKFTHSDRVSATGLCLPSSAGLTAKEIETIVRNLKDVPVVRQMMAESRKAAVATGGGSHAG